MVIIMIVIVMKDKNDDNNDDDKPHSRLLGKGPGPRFHMNLHGFGPLAHIPYEFTWFSGPGPRSHMKSYGFGDMGLDSMRNRSRKYESDRI